MATTIQEVELEEVRFCIMKALAENELKHLRVDTSYSLFMHSFIVSASWGALAYKMPNTISYPSDWWEAFKHRWFTRSMKNRWPVKYDIYRAQQVLPAIAWPEAATRHSFCMFEKVD